MKISAGFLLGSSLASAAAMLIGIANEGTGAVLGVFAVIQAVAYFTEGVRS
jgi:hypothetical protein